MNKFLLQNSIIFYIYLPQAISSTPSTMWNGQSVADSDTKTVLANVDKLAFSKAKVVAFATKKKLSRNCNDKNITTQLLQRKANVSDFCEYVQENPHNIEDIENKNGREILDCVGGDRDKLPCKYVF